MAEYHPTTSRSLLDLPLEIKLEMYRLAFDDMLPELVLCMCCKSVTPFSNRVPLEILAICHKLRDEALPVFCDTLAETRLSLKYETAPYHGRPRPMRGHKMLETYGSLFRDITIDAEDASNFLGMLPRLTGLQRLTVDYSSPSRPTASIFSGLDRKERYLGSEYDHWSWGVWRNVARMKDHESVEWKKVMHDIAEDRPSFQVSVLVVFNIGPDRQGNPAAMEELVSLLDLGSNTVVKKWFKSTTTASISLAQHDQRS